MSHVQSEIQSILKEVVHVLNGIKRTNYNYTDGRTDTYKLASKIDNFLKKLDDQLLDSWHIDDVLAEAEHIGVTLTNDEAREILSSLDDIGAESGINWDSIGAIIEQHQIDKSQVN